MWAGMSLDQTEAGVGLGFHVGRLEAKGWRMGLAGCLETGRIASGPNKAGGIWRWAFCAGSGWTLGLLETGGARRGSDGWSTRRSGSWAGGRRATWIGLLTELGSRDVGLE